MKIRSVQFFGTTKGYYFFLLPFLRIENNEIMFSVQAGICTLVIEINLIKA
jgi:hypothetical protein